MLVLSVAASCTRERAPVRKLVSPDELRPLQLAFVDLPRLASAASMTGFCRAQQHVWPVTLDELARADSSSTSQPTTQNVDTLGIGAYVCLPRDDHRAVVVLQTRSKSTTAAFDVSIERVDETGVTVHVSPSTTIHLFPSGVRSDWRLALRLSADRKEVTVLPESFVNSADLDTAFLRTLLAKPTTSTTH